MSEPMIGTPLLKVVMVLGLPEEQQLAQAAAPAAPEAAKDVAKAKTKKDAGAGSGSGSGRGGGRQQKALCLCPDCDEPRKGNKKRCADHNRSWEAMQYQAANSEEEDALAAWTMLNNPQQPQSVELGRVVAEFPIDNHPSANYTRKKLTQRASFRRSYGIRTSNADLEVDVPMMEGEYIKWLTETECIPEAEAKREWQKHLDNPRIRRDTDGINGRQQLWIPNAKKEAVRKRERYEDNTQDDGRAVQFHVFTSLSLYIAYKCIYS